MGSKVLAILDIEPPEPHLEHVPAWFEEWEQTLSRFRLDSELSRLNANPGTEQALSQTMWDVLQVAVEADTMTRGLVNPLILEALLSAGYDRPFDLLEMDPRSNETSLGRHGSRGKHPSRRIAGA